MAIRFYQTDPSDPLNRKVWRNMSASDPEQMIEKLVEALSAPDQPDSATRASRGAPTEPE